MKKINYIHILLCFLTIVFNGCEENDYEFGKIITPSNIQVIAEIVGADEANPNGDGSGTVHFTATADNAVSYKFVYDGNETVSLSGTNTYNFSNLGLHTYTVTVVVSGTAGVTSSTTIQVDVLSTYQIPEDLLTMLTANSSRTWRIKAEVDGHFGLGPVGGDPFQWFSAPAFDKENTGMYDDRFIFNVDGTFTYLTGDDGTIFGKAEIMDIDLGPTTLDTPNACCAEYENYPLLDFETSWALSAPAGVETLSLSGLGFIGYYIGGSHKYEIYSRSDNEMILKTTDWNSSFDWWFLLVAE